MGLFRPKSPKNRVFDLLDPGYTRYGMFYACLGKKMIFVKFWIFSAIFRVFMAEKQAKIMVFLIFRNNFKQQRNTWFFACFLAIKSRKMVKKIQNFTKIIFLPKQA